MKIFYVVDTHCRDRIFGESIITLKFYDIDTQAMNLVEIGNISSEEDSIDDMLDTWIESEEAYSFDTELVRL